MATTRVSGNAISDVCVRRAGMLNLDIYDRTREELSNRLKPFWDLNKKVWTVDLEVERPDGFLARLYVPKAAAGGDPSGFCPPVLCFRGSDSEPEDFAELAGAMRLAYSYRFDPPLLSERVGAGTVDKTVSASKDFNGIPMAKMDTKGLNKEALFSGVTGSKTIPVGVWNATRGELTIDWTVDAALYYGVNGDWAVNFAQGLGQVLPPQYQRAIDIGKQVAAVAMANWGGRLIVTGHSLGGGLASAAAIAARIAEPDLVMRAVTYNAAGLHQETAKRAGGTRSTADQVPVRAVHVAGEILNSMQARSRLVPFLADLLIWGGKSMPSAVANPTPVKGVSPGVLDISKQKPVGELDPLPTLYTVDRQTVGPRMQYLHEIVGLANSSNDIGTFVSRLIDYVLGHLSRQEVFAWDELIDLGISWATTLDVGPGFQKQLLLAIEGKQPPPTLNFGISGYQSNVVEPFVNGLISDFVTLARVLMFSGDYHTFTTCAYTFLLDTR